MGLTIVVGVRLRDPDAPHGLERINAMLAQAGLPAHVEPRSLRGWPHADPFDVDMIGYRGLHLVRRLAAGLAWDDALPAPARVDGGGDEETLEREWFMDHFDRPDARFAHLMLHSDCAGVYVPIDFPAVLVDADDPRDDLAWLGSSQRLLAECREIAVALGLPPLDDPRLRERLRDDPHGLQGEGEGWERYAMEVVGLVALLEAVELSVRTGALIEFR